MDYPKIYTETLIRRQKDKLLRTKAQAKGFKILEMPAEALYDKTMLADYLDILDNYFESKIKHAKIYIRSVHFINCNNF